MWISHRSVLDNTYEIWFWTYTYNLEWQSTFYQTFPQYSIKAIFCECEFWLRALLRSCLAMVKAIHRVTCWTMPGLRYLRSVSDECGYDLDLKKILDLRLRVGSIKMKFSGSRENPWMVWHEVSQEPFPNTENSSGDQWQLWTLITHMWLMFWFTLCPTLACSSMLLVATPHSWPGICLNLLAVLTGSLMGLWGSRKL